MFTHIFFLGVLEEFTLHIKKFISPLQYIGNFSAWICLSRENLSFNDLLQQPGRV